ncbi:MAG: antitoxin VapB family protein [Candidatus Aenigmarchaeota archaeon]|nr:antitoxin VapB family protein [Candidatus Aenigmarchaeota archaeon]
MATKTISIMEEAYEALLREKNKGESFTDVILRLAERRGKLADSFGKWKMRDKEWNAVRKELDRAWKSWK